MALAVQQGNWPSLANPFGGSITPANYGWGVVSNYPNWDILIGPTFARHIDAVIGMNIIKNCGLVWDSYTSPKNLCIDLFRIFKDDKGLWQAMTKDLQW